MAIQSVATANSASSQTPARIERDSDVEIGGVGVVQIMERYTYQGRNVSNHLDGLTDQELVTIHGCVTNEEDALINGLRTVADLVCGFGKDVGGELDGNGIGWLVKTLAESLDSMSNLKWAATDELSRRGYDSNGYRLSKEG